MERKMSEEKRPMGFAIWGCGTVARIHGEAIEAMSEGVLIGAGDLRKERAGSLTEIYGGRTYEDYGELLADPQVDVVCICTPSGFHGGDALRALEAGKHVILEKPMALTLEEADTVAEAARRSGRILTVVSQMRFSEDIQKVKSLVEQGAFGNLVFCNLHMKYWRDPQYYAASSWRGTLALDGGGALMNQGIHGVDLLLYLVGRANVLQGCVRTRSHAIEAEDTAAALLEFENGALGMLEASTCTSPGFARCIEIHGDQGYVILQENRIEELSVKGSLWKRSMDSPEGSLERGSGRREKQETGPASGSRDPAAIGSGQHRLQFENMVAAIRGEEPLMVTPEDGRRAVELILEVYRSSGTITPQSGCTAP